MTAEKMMVECPFCGGQCDPEGWLSQAADGTDRKTGPACDDCGASAPTIESWNGWKVRSTVGAGAREALKDADLGDLSKHGMNCGWYDDDSGCTCSLKWRVALSTERTMHRAWRKRAEEAEAALQSEPVQPAGKGEDPEASIPTYGNLPWDQLGRDVMESLTARRHDFDFDPKFYPGHQSPGINFNSLARIVDKYRLPVRPEAPAGVREYAAWLIEISETSGPTYFQLEYDNDWTTDHDAALHFSRKQDAEKAIAHYGWTSAKATEHCWPIPSDPARRTTQPIQRESTALNPITQQGGEK